jgi:hypothetical protein
MRSLEYEKFRMREAEVRNLANAIYFRPDFILWFRQILRFKTHR